MRKVVCSGIHALIQVFPSGPLFVQITVFSILDISFNFFGDFRLLILCDVHGYLHKFQASLRTIGSYLL